MPLTPPQDDADANPWPQTTKPKQAQGTSVHEDQCTGLGVLLDLFGEGVAFGVEDPVARSLHQPVEEDIAEKATKLVRQAAAGDVYFV